MYFGPSMLQVEHIRACDPHASSNGRNHPSLVEPLAGVHCVGLDDAVLANDLRNQCAVLCGMIAFIEQVFKLRVKSDAEMVVTVLFGNLSLKDPCDRDAGI